MLEDTIPPLARQTGPEGTKRRGEIARPGVDLPDEPSEKFRRAREVEHPNEALEIVSIFEKRLDNRRDPPGIATSIDPI